MFETKWTANYIFMVIKIADAQISPVNVAERRDLGIRSGDTVRVHQKIQEKGKTRLQVFEGLVIARKHGSEAGATFTVRSTHSGVGVERIFTLYSPLIDKIEIVRRSKVRRAKLYYIRNKVAREIRRQLRNMKLMGVATESEREVADKQAQAVKEEEEKVAAEAAAKEEAEKVAAEAAQAEEKTEEAEAPTEEPAKQAEPEEVPAEEEAPAVEAEDKKEG